MATAVLDLDLKNLPPKVDGLDQYDKALILIRYNRKPIGQIILPVKNGGISPEEHYKDIRKAVGPTLKDCWLHDCLGWDGRCSTEFIPPKATVAVCTRDRPDDLRRCLEALMKLPNDGQEILIIDNCPSTDATRKLVAGYEGVRYVCEERPGLDNARNRALSEARHEIVAFTDDDATPDPDWLRALLQNFDDPLVMAVTGLTMPLELETEAQEVFERYSPFGKGFKRVIYSAKYSNPLATGKVGAGANMALRRSIQHQIGLFDEALDAGTPTHSGGDHEMFARILVAGFRIVYDPTALSWHRHRRTHEELRKTLFGYGVGVYSLFARHLFLERELGVFAIGYKWFKHDQLPNLLKSVLRRPGSFPIDLLLAELRGCLVGTRAYYISSKRKSISK